MNIGELLVALDDEQIKAKIYSIVQNASRNQPEKPNIEQPQEGGSDGENTRRANQSKTRITQLESEKAQLLEQQIEQEKLQENTTRIIEQQQNKIAELEALISLSEEKHFNLQDKLNFYQECFESDLRLYHHYQELSQASKNSLAGIFKDDSIQSIVSCGVQEQNISNLWDYIKDQLIHKSDDNTQNLISLFDLLFARFTQAFPHYQRLTPQVGEDFDTQLHIRHNASTQVSGHIAQALLCGYINTRNRKVLKQSVVMI